MKEQHNIDISKNRVMDSEQETPDIEFTEVPYNDFSDNVPEDINDIDDLEEPDRYVEDNSDDTNQNNAAELQTGKIFNCSMIFICT